MLNYLDHILNKSLGSFFIILSTVILVRIVYFILFVDLGNKPVGDEWEYIKVAENLLLGKGFLESRERRRIIFSEPIFPILISACIFIFSNEAYIFVINILLTALGLWFYYQILVQYTKKTYYKLFFIIFLASHPYLCFYNFTYLAESLRFFGLALMIRYTYLLIETKNIKNIIIFWNCWCDIFDDKISILIYIFIYCIIFISS